MTTRMKFPKRIMNALIQARESSVRLRIRQHLRSLSDRHLEDMGFSRELLEQGPKAWPWRAPVEPHGTPMLAAAMQRRNSAGQTRPADQFDRSSSDDKLAA